MIKIMHRFTRSQVNQTVKHPRLKRTATACVAVRRSLSRRMTQLFPSALPHISYLVLEMGIIYSANVALHLSFKYLTTKNPESLTEVIEDSGTVT